MEREREIDLSTYWSMISGGIALNACPKLLVCFKNKPFLFESQD